MKIDQILVGVGHVEGLAVPLGHVVGLPFRLILMCYCIKGKVNNFGGVSLSFLGVMA